MKKIRIKKKKKIIPLIKTGNILRGYKNSIIVTVFSIFLVIFWGAMLGIIVSRRKDRKANLIYYFFLFGLTATMQMVTPIP